MSRSIRGLELAIAGALVIIAAVTAGSLAQSPSAPASPAPDAVSEESAAREYCTDQGGQLVDRVATWNTNGDPSQWVALAGRMTLCEFEMGEGDQTTRISVDLRTLYAAEPTLAGLAYLAKMPPTRPEQPGANPATVNCDQGLGGASEFGAGVAGGGWVDASQPVFVVMNLCMFADGSAIDEWGIFYYADGAVRGADLATKMRYQQGPDTPAIFGGR
jgi:putative hemolysin